MTEAEHSARVGRWAKTAGGPLVAMALALAMCAAGKATESRRKLGERYALAFSNNALGRRVSWDDAACAFTEKGPDTDRPDVHASIATRIPAALVTVEAKARGTSRIETLDVTFRCDPPTDPCIARMHRYGRTVISKDSIAEHTMGLSGSIGDVPRLEADLGRLRLDCSIPVADAGG